MRLWERHGPEAVREVLAAKEFPGRKGTRHPLPAKLHRLAHGVLDAEDGLATLQRAWAAERSPAGRVAYLRSCGTTWKRAVGAVNRLVDETEPEPLPWAELVASHRADPLPEHLLAVLANHDGCPTELWHEARAARLRESVRGHVPADSGPRPSALDLLRRHPVHDLGNFPDGWLSEGIDLGELTLLDVVYEARPAVGTVRYLADRPPHRRWLPAHREARRLVAKHLGEDVEAWAMALTLLPDFEGTLPELLSTAAAVVS